MPVTRSIIIKINHLSIMFFEKNIYIYYYPSYPAPKTKITAKELYEINLLLVEIVDTGYAKIYNFLCDGKKSKIRTHTR